MGQKSRYVLPSIVDPPKTVCYRIEVPNERQHIAAFMGAMWGLGRAFEWQNDDAHTALQVAEVWRRVFYTIKPCNVIPPNTAGFAGAGGGDDEFMIRQNPDNPCLLETSVNGTEWCTWADLSLCVPGGTQPGGGSEQPPPGGSACYNGQMAGNSQWLLPTVVRTGYVITVSNLGGAVGDAPFGGWTCPDGTVFLFGACVPSTGGHAGGDPSGTAFHGALIVSIDGTWYDITSGPITVPGGVSSVPVYFQVNDSDISDNQGQYTFKVCVENNEPADWESTLDFKTNAYSSIMNSVDYATTWVSGSGYEGGPIDSNSLHVAQINIGIDSSRITSLSIRYTAGGGSGPNGQVQTRINVYAAYGTPGAVGSGSNLLYGQFGDTSGVTALIPGINSGTTDAQVILHSLKITGKGTKPSQLP